MKKSCLIIFGSVLSLSGIPSSNAALNCTAAPDCASLGYTMTAADCIDGVKVACPTDPSKVFCKTGCTVGSFLFSDGQCHALDNPPQGVKAIGVVFDTSKKLAVSFEPDGLANTWSTELCLHPNVSCYENGNVSLPAEECATDGELNTRYLIEAWNPYCKGSNNVAEQARYYYKSFVECNTDFCQKKEWFLPSISELRTLYSVKEIINESLAQVDGRALGSIYWSSTQKDTTYAYALNMDTGDIINSGQNQGRHGVRAVISYSLAEGECNVLNCTQCADGDNNICSNCETGYSLTGEGKCIFNACSSSVANCEFCRSPGSSYCVECRAGYKPNGGICERI